MKWIGVIMVLFICGCSSTQIREEFIGGMSAQDARNASNKRIETFDMSSETCFDKISAVLKNQMQANLLRLDREERFILVNNLNKAYKCINTTEVGILIHPSGKDKAEVAVVSGSSPLADFVSAELSKRLRETSSSGSDKEAVK